MVKYVTISILIGGDCAWNCTKYPLLPSPTHVTLENVYDCSCIYAYSNKPKKFMQLSKSMFDRQKQNSTRIASMNNRCCFFSLHSDDSKKNDLWVVWIEIDSMSNKQMINQVI